MIAKGSSIDRPASPRRGLTLVEMVISMVLVGISLVAALNAVGTSKLAQVKVSVSGQGYLLAQDLMTEILLQGYEEPAETGNWGRVSGNWGQGLLDWGRESSESVGDRTDYDDVDDYDGWSSLPPEYKDGAQIPNLDGWERSVTVVWADPSDISKVVGSNQGLKRITVTVRHDDVPVAELVALKTIGLSPLEACCFDDGSCEDLRVEACAIEGGTAQGPDTICATAECPTGPAVLFVVADDTNPTAQELARQALMESWDFSVELIAASAWQSDFDTAVADADVAYVSREINDLVLSTKLTAASIGVVNEEVELHDELGFAENKILANERIIGITDATHYITSVFSTGPLTILLSTQPLHMLDELYAPDLQVLAVTDTGVGGKQNPSLVILESGDALYGGGVAAGRRVQLPWGDTGFDFNSINTDAKTIMQRAIEWAAGMEQVCGDADCSADEDPCNCAADCGPPTAFEQPGVTCDDGMDNDCDGDTDCGDINCLADLACSCGNGNCDPNEDCTTCSADCKSKTNGPPPGQYCCGNGIAESGEGDGSICDGNY